MDLKEQLKNLFPDHKTSKILEEALPSKCSIYIQDSPIICKYEKRNGKPVTILEEYCGSNKDFKSLTKLLKTTLSVGGSFKQDIIIIQGDYRDKIMKILKDLGFNIKRVGG